MFLFVADTRTQDKMGNEQSTSDPSLEETKDTNETQIPVNPVELMEAKVKLEISQWTDITRNGVIGVCEPLNHQLHLEAVHEELESWKVDEEPEQVNKKVVDKCLQVLIDMPSGKTKDEEDRNTIKDMNKFMELFRHAMNVVEGYEHKRKEMIRIENLEKKESSLAQYDTNNGWNDDDSGGDNGNDDDDDDTLLLLSTDITCHDDDKTVPVAREIIRACLMFLCEVGKLTTTDGTDAWFGMKDAIKKTNVIPAIVRLLLQHPTHNSFVFWGLNALYFCCRDGAFNDLENVEKMLNADGLKMVEILNQTCRDDPGVLVHVQLLQTMLTMKDDDDEDLLDSSLATHSGRVIESGPGFGQGNASNSHTFRPGYY